MFPQYGFVFRVVTKGRDYIFNAASGDIRVRTCMFTVCHNYCTLHCIYLMMGNFHWFKVIEKCLYYTNHKHACMHIEELYSCLSAGLAYC